MNLLGKEKEGINFTFCNQFRPTLLDSQLCYSLNLSSIVREKTVTGKRAGLVFLLDVGGKTNDETHVDQSKIENALDLESSGTDTSSATIYLNTMSSYIDYRAGSYAMTALKKMTGTESFLKQTTEERKCMIQTLERCQATSYIDSVQKKCDCVPWALSSALTEKV